MKLSLLFELLLIFVLLAFAASKNIKKDKNNRKGLQNRNTEVKQETNDSINGINKYCKCSENHCNCCRDFSLPVVNLEGPGCASLMYLLGDRMAVSLSFGDRVITNRTLSGRKPSPVCMPLPGGVSKFCGRVYNIARSGEDFRACLGLELQSKKSVEAAIRVSCFKFGAKGVNAEPADPLPLVPQDENKDDEDDDDDDDDDFGLGGDDDDDDDEDDDEDDDDSGLDAVNDVDGGDYTGFSLLGDDLLGDLFGSSGGKKSNKNKNKKKQAPSTTTTTTTTTKRPRTSRRPIRRTTTPKPQRSTTVKIRPTTRKPNRRRTARPNRKSTTAIPISSYPVTSQDEVPQITNSHIQTQHTTEYNSIPDSTAEQSYQPVSLAHKPTSSESSSTPNSPTVDDPGLQLSLAHITGQLSDMPVTTIVTPVKDNGTKNKLRFEKIETITPKNPTTIAFSSTSEDRDVGSQIDDDMVQIVQTLDSQSSEHIPTSVEPASDEARGQNGYLYNYYSHSDTVNGDYYEGLSLPKKKHKKNNVNDYDDVLGLTSIGESIIHGYHSLGLNGGKRKHKEKVGNGRKNNNDYDDILGFQALSETLGLENGKKNGNKRNKDNKRRNKMMKGDWDMA